MMDVACGRWTFHVVADGPPNGPPVLLLHGFPGSVQTWDLVAPRLAAQGFRVYRYTQRGYEPDARPASRFCYRIDSLVRDALTVIEHVSGSRPIHLVGHDWGGMLGWSIGSTRPDVLASLTVLSTPHPRAFTSTLPFSAEALKSLYMLLFQPPFLPELVLAAKDGLILRHVLLATGLPPAAVDNYLSVLLLAGCKSLGAALNWYRSMPFDSAKYISMGCSPSRTLYIYGSRDQFVSQEAARRTVGWIGAGGHIKMLDSTHWLPETCPEQVTSEIVRFLLGG